MEYSPEINLTNKSQETETEKVNMGVFETRIQAASPNTLNQIWNVMKSKETWAGLLIAAAGSYLCNQAFVNEPMMIQNIMESMKENAPNPDPEKIRQVLLALKIIAASVLAEGAVLVFAGFLNKDKAAR